MMDEKRAKIVDELFDKERSNLKTPIIGEIFTPVCLSCTNYQRGKGLDPSTCKSFGEIPHEFIHCKSVDCPEYQLIPDCPKYNLRRYIEMMIKPLTEMAEWFLASC